MCGCGGGSVQSPLHSSMTPLAPRVVQPDQYLVTYPGVLKEQEIFDDETEAYRAISRRGGGIKRIPRK